MNIANSLANSGCFVYGLIDLIFINLAILSEFYCLICKSALRSLVFAIRSEKKCYSVSFFNKSKIGIVTNETIVCLFLCNIHRDDKNPN